MHKEPTNYIILLTPYMLIKINSITIFVEIIFIMSSINGNIVYLKYTHKQIHKTQINFKYMRKRET